MSSTLEGKHLDLGLGGKIAQLIGDLPFFRLQNVTAGAVELVQYTTALDNRLAARRRPVDILIGGRLGNQSEYERHNRFALLVAKGKLRHPQPLVVLFVVCLFIVVTARLAQLLVEEADAYHYF